MWTFMYEIIPNDNNNKTFKQVFNLTWLNWKIQICQ